MTTETPSLYQPRLCVDCLHYLKPNRDYPQARCGRKTLGISMVDGAKLYALCIEERSLGFNKTCGPNATFWTKRTDKLPF